MEQIIFEKSHIGRVILSYLSSKDLFQFRLVSHKANKLASSDDVWKDKLINKYGQEIFSVPHNRPSLFKLYLELDTDCKSVLNLIKQGDLFYLHWMNLNDTPFNEWDVSYSEKHGTQEITEWLN